MKKDVIYIDIEDDITSIIEKIKKAEAKIVALVPPKRIGVLQSVVNLKLLARAAKGSDHHIVLITNDHALTALAAGISLPVAKNLQSKPEIAPIAALDVDDEDVINGSELPVGEHAEAAAKKTASTVGEATLAAAAADSAEEIETDAPVAPIAATMPKKPAKKGAKIPNFDLFRKRFFLIAGLGTALVVFLIWAIWFAPHAVVTISAKTTTARVNQIITLNPNAPSNPTSSTIKPLMQQVKKNASTSFTATGTKNVGQRATGQVKLTNQTADALTVPAGTQFTASGKVFTNDAAVSLPASSTCGFPVHICYGTATTNITAADLGPDYNLPGPVTFSASAPVDATSQNGTAGGTSQTVTVVSQEDVTKAQSQLTSQNQDQIKADLRRQFSGDVIVVSESFVATPGSPSVTPGIGEQATTAKLSIETTYTLLAISRPDAKAFLTHQLQPSVKTNERIYTTGDAFISFSQFATADGGTYTVRLSADGHIGPNIDTIKLAKQIEGKHIGDVQQIVAGYGDVDNVDVRFSPFWVNTIPSADKTDIEFKVTNGS